MARQRVVFRMAPGFPERIVESPSVDRYTAVVGAEVAVLARRFAPKGRTLNLSESIEVERSAGGRWRVWARDFKASWHEFGTAKMHAHPFLRPAVRLARGVTRFVEDARGLG